MSNYQLIYRTQLAWIKVRLRVIIYRSGVINTDEARNITMNQRLSHPFYLLFSDLRGLVTPLGFLCFLVYPDDRLLKTRNYAGINVKTREVSRERRKIELNLCVIDSAWLGLLKTKFTITL